MRCISPHIDPIEKGEEDGKLQQVARPAVPQGKRQSGYIADRENANAGRRTLESRVVQLRIRGETDKSNWRRDSAGGYDEVAQHVKRQAVDMNSVLGLDENIVHIR